MAMTMLRALPTQASAARCVPAAKSPVVAIRCIPAPVSKAFSSGVANFPNGKALRCGLVSSRCTSSLGRQRLSVSSAAATDVQEETHEYQAEVHRMMDMIVNSLYSNREVFLRELVSNGSDALDKMRFEGLTDRAAFETGEELEMRIKADKDNHTITIEDTGIGMTKEELLDSLGTIARSGTAKFAEKVKQTKGDAQLIGQFGVGFYSSFLVADRVTVQSKSNSSDKTWLWESAAGSHSFKVREDDSGEPLKRGTRVTLHLKEDAYELADEKKLQDLIKQYSEFIQFPIRLWSTKQEQEKVLDEEATKRKQDAADAKAKEEGKDEAEAVEPVMRTTSKSSQEWQIQNDSKPLWTRPPREVSGEEYDAFFKQTFKEFLEPLAHSHFNVEGTIEFTAMLFVPGMAPFEQQDAMARSRNIKLFVKRVFISDEFDEDLMPRYLSFIKGVVDSSDLPLNVSREILQESRVVRVIKRQLVKRSLDMLREVSERPAEGDKRSDYSTFWESFGRNLKLGCIEDSANRKVLSELLRFPSSQTGEDMTSLKEYTSRMKEGQKDIFYMAADSLDAASSAPFVERLVQRDYEVLYLTEPIDEVAIQNLADYDDKKFVDVSREGIDLGTDDQDTKKAEEQTEQLKSLTDFMAKVLGEKVEKVVVSQRLADSPCALVTSKFGYSANMERIMKTQAMGDSRAMEYMRGRRTLEVNPDHPVIASLKARYDEHGDSDEDSEAMTELLYETSLLTSGFSVESPKEFANRIYGMMSGVSSGNGTSRSQRKQSKQSSGPAVDPEILGADPKDPWN
ncbi:Heat shock protein 90-5, chloroplastic [Trebouxia sp. C0009 RCD-2024]